MAKNLEFLKIFEKELVDLGMDDGSAEPPRYWFSTGNYVANKTLSGSYLNGIPQGRITALTGPSTCGKSFLLCNIIREAQKAGAYVFVVDSEHALDDEFVSKIGVNPSDSYKYAEADTIPECSGAVSAFLRAYKAEYDKDDTDAPKVLIAIDSLNMLSTETEAANFEKGVTKGDMGQTNRQLKQMLKSFVRAIKHHNISIVVTSHVYANQNVLNGEGNWIIADAIKYSCSQIALLTKLKMREGEASKREVTGVEIKVEAFKTRFTKPFQTVKLEVPYDTGMDPYNGLFEVAVETGIVEKAGSMYHYNGEKYKGKDNFPKELFPDLLVKCEANRQKFLEAVLDDVEEVIEDEPSSKSKREKKHKEK